MRRIMAIIVILILNTSLIWSGQLDNDLSVTNYFASQQLTAQTFFDNENMVDDNKELPLAGDIYEFEAKSPKRAFLYSMILPGAGQYYAGSRIKPIVYLGLESLIWSFYFTNHSKGNDKKKEYQQYAIEHYSWVDFMAWWNSLDSTIQIKYSHRLPWDDENNRVIMDHEYFENIGKYDQFQIGWDDIPNDAYPPPPETNPVYFEGTTREVYVNLRKNANDYYQNANTMIMLSLGNRIISAFEAALTAKKFNKGQKRFSFNMETRKFGETDVPVLTWNYRF